MRLTLFQKNIRQLSDEELLSLFAKKDDAIYLGELYSRYIHLVYGVCLKYFKDVEKAKDAVSNIYEKIQTDINKHEVKNFKSWLYVVSKNHCLMALRKHKSGSLVFTHNDDELNRFMENEPELHPIDKESNPEETDKALADCIEQLKAEQKSCIRLFYFDNKCYREISEALNTEIKKVKSYIQNAKRNLKICLEQKNEQQ